MSFVDFSEKFLGMKHRALVLARLVSVDNLTKSAFPLVGESKDIRGFEEIARERNPGSVRETRAQEANQRPFLVHIRLGHNSS